MTNQNQPYSTVLFDERGTAIQVREHDSLARAAQDARTSMLDEDCPAIKSEVRTFSGVTVFVTHRGDLPGHERPRDWFEETLRRGCLDLGGVTP